MDRLSNRGIKGEIWITDNDLTRRVGKKEVAYDRLAAYEDTGLEPEKISAAIKANADFHAKYDSTIPWYKLDHAAELLAAEKDGRVVVMPCKVGDEVWVTWYGVATHATITKVFIERTEVCNSTLICATVSNGQTESFFQTEVGKTVFLTKPVAEAALKKGDE